VSARTNAAAASTQGRDALGWTRTFATAAVWLSLGAGTVPGVRAHPQAPAADAPAQTAPEKTPKAVQKADKQAKKADKKKDDNQPIAAADLHNPVLWQDPGDIAAKDMLHGLGGEEHQPKAPFTFQSEDHNGTNPKFDARDADDKKWRVKLGVEARPEVVTSRLLWAVGYFTEDDYVLPQATVPGLKLDRGMNLVSPGGMVTDARFSRRPSGQDKIAIWRWKDNPFTGKREFNGLRVMMAVVNNWDLKDVNNAVYSDSKGDRQLFLASDIGATFGANGEHKNHRDDKSNAAAYAKSLFITKREKTTITFCTPHQPYGFAMHTYLFGEYFRRLGLRWIGHDIPRDDARWIGEELGKLSHQQLVDAFKAADYSPEDTDIFVRTLEHRIAELKAL
jgi:hypothetical protein